MSTKAQKAIDKARAEVRRDWEYLGTRRVLYQTIYDSCLFSPNLLVPGSHDQTYFNLGARAKGLALFSEVMDACPELFVTAYREANQVQEPPREDDSE